MADKKILIVDYDQKSLESLTKLFTARQIRVLKATDGQMAYEIYQKESPDLIILEAMLPKLHGFDLTQKIYEETKGGIPVVIVTGLYKGPQYKNEALRSFGAADYFEKPFNQDRLLGSVINLLHDEVDIEDDLPDPAAVIEMVSKLGAGPDKTKTKK